MKQGLLSAVVATAGYVFVLTACHAPAAGSDDTPPALAVAPRFEVTPQQATLRASNSRLFGAAIALSGDTAVIGASRDDQRGDGAGAAFVYIRTGSRWVQQAKLVAADGAANDNFGVSVAISGETIIVGAMFNDGRDSDAGAAYVFTRAGGAWSQQAKLTADDGGPEDQLGISVGLDGDTAIVGTTFSNARGYHSGAAYVYGRSAGAWAQQAKLTAADGVDSDQFGISVAVSGDSAAVGAYGDDDNGRSSGSVYVFDRTAPSFGGADSRSAPAVDRAGTAWAQQAKLLASDGKDIDELGISVALLGDTLIAGAVFGDAAYVYTRSAGAWSQQAKLTAADGASGDDFGNSVALLGDTAVVGAPYNSALGAESGIAYVFTRTGTAWAQQATMRASDGTSGDQFGFAVAVSGDTILSGAIGQNSATGAVYVYAPPLTNSNNGIGCSADAECSSGSCVDGVCCNTTCGGGDPSDCQACSIAAGGASDGTCGPKLAGTVCRGAAGACDVAETCDGASLACPADHIAAADTICRAATGSCDVAERCTGDSPICPGDQVLAAGTTCRPSAGACDPAETCDGHSGACPDDHLASAAVTCRPSAGACDPAEHCTGNAPACPSDQLASATTVCRPANGSCDVVETCTGNAPLCPPDALKPNLAICKGVLGLPGLCLAGVCL